MIDLLQSYGPIGGVAIASLGVTGLGIYLAILIVKRQKNGKYLGPERRAPSEDQTAFRQELREVLGEIRTDVREIRSKTDDLVPRVAVLETDIRHLKKHCPLMEQA